MAVYQSEFQGATIDARLAAVATMQTAISNLETAVAAKYSKPSSGIPETDLDASVQAALALARTAIQSLSDYYTKAQVDDITAAIAASVDSTSGVVVATLPSAGAGTLGKIYYVGPDANGFYDRYVTSYDGSTYSWLALGNTEVDMTQYAKKESVDNLYGSTSTDFYVQPGVNYSSLDVQVRLPIPANQPFSFTVQDKTCVSSGKYSLTLYFSDGTSSNPVNPDLNSTVTRTAAKDIVAVGAYISSGKITTAGLLTLALEYSGALVPSVDAMKVSLSETKENVDSNTQMLGDVPPAIMAEDLGYSSSDATFVSGYAAANASLSGAANSPFLLDLHNSRSVLIDGIMLKVATAGTMTVGKVKKSDVVSGSTFDRTKVTDKQVVTASYIGAQTIQLKKMLIDPDEYLSICMPGDTIVFNYGANGTNKGFLYVSSSGAYVYGNSDSLGLDVLGKTFAAGAAGGSTYSGKKISILGDSISTFSGYIPEGNVTYYPAGTIQSVQDTWWKKLIDALGMELLVNNSWSGSRVTTTDGESSAGCMARCQALGDNPDVIVVWMGINDFNNEVALGTYDGTTALPSDTTTFLEAYAIMLDKILAAYPIAEVWVCTLPQCEKNGATGFPEINGNGVALASFNEGIRKLARAFGVKILDHASSGLTYQNMETTDPDHLHPNQVGHSLFANNDIWQMDNYVRFRYPKPSYEFVWGYDNRAYESAAQSNAIPQYAPFAPANYSSIKGHTIKKVRLVPGIAGSISILLGDNFNQAATTVATLEVTSAMVSAGAAVEFDVNIPVRDKILMIGSPSDTGCFKFHQGSVTGDGNFYRTCTTNVARDSSSSHLGVSFGYYAAS